MYLAKIRKQGLKAFIKIGSIAKHCDIAGIFFE